MMTIIHLDYLLSETFERSQINFRKISPDAFDSFFFDNQSITYLFSLTLRKIERRKKVKNEPISRMIEHFDSANDGITSIRSWISIREGKGERHGTETTSWREEKRWRERKRECEKRRTTSECDVAPWRYELFYSLNIGPNQTPSALRAREYKCSPSRLYNHGSVKLTSQSCNQLRNSARTGGRYPNPGHRPLPRVLKFLRCPNLNPYPRGR